MKIEFGQAQIDLTNKIKYLLKFLSDNASELSYDDIDWAVKMEEAFEAQHGTLTPKQIKVLEDLYAKYSGRV